MTRDSSSSKDIIWNVLCLMLSCGTALIMDVAIVLVYRPSLSGIDRAPCHVPGGWVTLRFELFAPTRPKSLLCCACRGCAFVVTRPRQACSRQVVTNVQFRDVCAQCAKRGWAITLRMFSRQRSSAVLTTGPQAALWGTAMLHLARCQVVPCHSQPGCRISREAAVH